MKKNILFSIIFALALACPVFAAVEDDAAVLYNKGIDFYEQNKLDQSIATFKKAIAIKPDFYEAYYNLARVEESAGKLADATASYEALLKLKPDDYDSRYEYGEILYRRGYLRKAVENLDKIPANSEIREKAETLTVKIKKRQIEVAEETRVKSEQAKRAVVVDSIPAPSGLVIDSKGNIYIASFSQNSIFKISANGQNKTVFADKTKGVAGPVGLTIDSYDNIYIANFTKGNIMLVDKKGNASILMYAKKPYYLSLNEAGKKLYVTEQANNSVISYDLSEIFKNSEEKNITETPKKDKDRDKDKDKDKKEARIITTPSADKNPPGTPSITQAGFTKGSPQSDIISPIMVPSENAMGF